ncbi:MAG: DUF3500 domain-containing protein [Verrucomicrobiales bacterium]|nr:DUF3500 domain-containing protein [Verrucomicrobiales bacterium]
MHLLRLSPTVVLMTGTFLATFLPHQINAQPATLERATRGTNPAVSAAEAFLATLDGPARAKAIFPFDNAEQRKRWSNLPTGIYKRAGLRLGDLSRPQRDAALAFLASVLSPAGYQKVIGIMEGDELLTKNAPGGNIVFGRDEYYLSFLGAPSAQNPWLIQFGGHHLALNITFVGDKGTLAPSHTAAQPAKFTWEGRTIRPLGAENDLSFELINALDDSQRKQAILGSEFRDLVLGPGQEGKKIVPEGVKVSTFTAKQRALLTDLIQQWVGILNADTAAPRMSEIKSGLGETWFAWSGPTTPGSAAYFRIQGPTLFIEYSPQRLGGDATQHIHTMYRDFSNEFGAKWLKP